jgi:hypothetical protein
MVDMVSKILWPWMPLYDQNLTSFLQPGAMKIPQNLSVVSAKRLSHFNAF